MQKERLKRFLSLLGIEIWQLKKREIPNSFRKKTYGEEGDKSLTWEKLEKKVRLCTLCSLCKSRTQTVFGVGNKKADLLFIGEAPGANEDLKGEPFVGRAGMLLNAMISSIGLKRDDVYIANILKCRPPNNRDPNPEEVKLCTPHLMQQIDLIRPKLIVAVGRIAAQFLIETSEPMARLRSQIFTFGAKKTPLIVTYHPAYLLRSPREKSKAYLDFLLIKKYVGKNACVKK